MSTTMTGLVNEALNILQKSSGTQGFYDSTKMTLFVNEAIDYLSCRMMESASGEWLEATAYKTMTAGDTSAALPTGTICIKKVSYLVGNVYQPLVYNELRHEVTYVGNTYAMIVSGVSVAPVAGDTYTNNSTTFTVQTVSLSGGAGLIYLEKTTGSNDPTTSGTLTRASGAGDATISFSAWSMSSSGIQQYPSSYFVRGDKIMFDPPVAIGGTNCLKIDYTALPTELAIGDNLPSTLHRAFQHYVAYRAAYTAASSIGKAQKEWADTYGEWMDMMLRMVDKRVDQPRWIKEFDQ